MTIVSDPVQYLDAQDAYAIERALDAVRGDRHPGRRKLRGFYAAVLSARDGQTRDLHDGLMDEMFDLESGDRSRRQLAVALVHLLSASPGAFSDAALADRAESVWDEELVDLFAALGIHADAQSASKRTALSDVVHQAEQELDGLVERAATIRTTSDLADFRVEYRAAFSSRLPVLGLFLPRELTETRLEKMLDSVGVVLAADEADFVKFWQRSWTVVRSYRDRAASSTAYAKRFLGELAEQILLCLDAYRLKRAATASVQVLPGFKKYPLHEDARHIRLALTLENSGAGPAIDTVLSFEAVAGLALSKTDVFVGVVGSGRQVVEVDAHVDVADLTDGRAQILGAVHWRNVDGNTDDEEFDLRIEPQRTDLDWERLSRQAPYSLTSISEPDQLIGRDQLINSLMSGLTGAGMPSCTISGQKRVGKTSIVKTLETRLRRDAPCVVVAYLQVGPYKSSPTSLYRAIANELVAAAKRPQSQLPGLDAFKPPSFEYGFSDILTLVDGLLDLDPRVRIVLILDEFDEIPSTLYQLNDEAGAFFNTLRDLTTRERASVILVGGENLPFVLTVSGAALNLLDAHRVDRFRRDDQFEDFADLVRRPVAGVIDVEPEAIEFLYEESTGHPYFAKWICKSLYAIMTERRDHSATIREVREAVERALLNAEVTAFAHFWDDGIFETDPGRRQEVARTRRLTLLAIGRALRSGSEVTREQLKAEAERMELSHADLGHAVGSYEQRGVLYETNGRVDTEIPFFRRWLKDRGTASIITDITDERARDRLQLDIEDATIMSDELAELSRSWGLFRNREIATDSIRAWLEQFGGVLAQRRALELIKQIRYFDSAEIARRCVDANQRLMQGRIRHLARGQQRFTDLLVVPLDRPEQVARIAQTYASIYLVENRIHKGNLVEKSALGARLLKTRRDVSALVFIDDFVATGENLIARLAELDVTTREWLREPGHRSGLVILAGFDKGVAAVESWLEEQDLPIAIDTQEVLGDEDRVFHSSSRYFSDHAERVATRDLFAQVGKEISPDHPLGLSDAQALVVFESSVPNHTLPHLWAEPDGERAWSPLFDRY